ncbi:hypothetical protein Tco_1291346 [Tanacetum coccineum]
MVEGCRGVTAIIGVTRRLGAVVMEVLGAFFENDLLDSSDKHYLEIRNVESTVDITKLFRKLKFICHWASPFKDFKRSNVPRVKLLSFSESDDTFTSLQALSNLHYLLSGFMEYFWSRKLNISNFGPANRHMLRHLPFQDGSEFHNRNLQAILANGVVSCSTLSDQGYAKDFYDQ